VLIDGFIITGNGPKKIVLRAIGPSINAADGTPLAGTLQDTVLELHGPDGSLITTNDNWKDTQQQQIVDSGLAPKDDRESAIVATLAPGAYTTIVSGKNGSSGIALVEAYDAGLSTPSQLANISTRGFVQTGNDVIIGGFILGGSSTGPSQVAIRGIGPSLAASNVANPLQDPVLDLRDKDGTRITLNDNYADDLAQAGQLAANGLTPKDSRESGMVVTLAPGMYTVILTGKDNGIGIGLLEVYNLR
jgi:hypothetical protein